MTLLLHVFHAGLVQKCILLGGSGVGAYSRWALVYFLGFQGGCLFEVCSYSKVGS